MALTPSFRRLGFLAFVLLSFTGSAQAQFPLVLESKVAEIVESTVTLGGGAFTLTVISNGTIDLSRVTKERVRFNDFSPEGTPINIGTRAIAAPTARKLVVTGGVANTSRALGEREMQIEFGDVRVAFTFTVAPPFVCPASCQLPRVCIDRKCVLPSTSCNPRCPVGQFCNEARKRCERRPPS